MARKTNAELQAEVDRLTLEVALLRAHKCPQPAYVPLPGPQCTCTAYGPGTAMCPVHQARGSGVFYTQFPPAGAAGGGWQTIIMNPLDNGGARPFEIADMWRNSGGAAPPPLTQIFTVSS